MPDMSGLRSRNAGSRKHLKSRSTLMEERLGGGRILRALYADFRRY